MSGSKWWATKIGTKLLSDLIIFSILFSAIPLDLHKSIRVFPLKCLMFFLVDVNNK